MNTKKEFIIENLSTVCKEFEVFLTESQLEAKYNALNNNAPTTQFNELGRRSVFNTCYTSGLIPREAIFRQYSDFMKMIRYIKKDKIPANAPIDFVLQNLRKFLSERSKYYSIMLIDETYNNYTLEWESNDQSEIVELMEPESLIIMVRSEPVTRRKRILQRNNEVKTIYITVGNRHFYRVLTRNQYLEEHGANVYQSMHFFDASTPIVYRKKQDYMEALYESNFDFEVPMMNRECTIDDYVIMHENSKLDIHTKEHTKWSQIAMEATVSKTQWSVEEYADRVKLLKAYLEFIVAHPETADLFDDIDTGICPCCKQKTKIKLNCSCRHCNYEITEDDLASMTNIDSCQGVAYMTYKPEWLEDKDIDDCEDWLAYIESDEEPEDSEDDEDLDE